MFYRKTQENGSLTAAESIDCPRGKSPSATKDLTFILTRRFLRQFVSEAFSQNASPAWCLSQLPGLDYRHYGHAGITISASTEFDVICKSCSWKFLKGNDSSDSDTSSSTARASMTLQTVWRHCIRFVRPLVHPQIQDISSDHDLKT